MGRPVCSLGGKVMLTLIFEKENVRTWSAYKQLRIASLAAFCVLYTARLLFCSLCQGPFTQIIEQSHQRQNITDA